MSASPLKDMADMGEEYCIWQSGPCQKTHQRFLKDIFRILEDAVFNGTDRKNKVVEWNEPSILKEKLDFELKQGGITHNELSKIMSQVVQYSVKVGHPYFINQLFSSLDIYGLVGQWITDALNPSVYTYEVAPVFTLMEIEVLKEMGKLVGYREQDGLFSPGGSISNMYAMILARYYAFPDSKKTGISSLGRLVVFTSRDAHYSLTKSAMTLGIGSQNLVLVNVDDKGRMDVDDLKKCIDKAKQDGATPIMVCATAGTTVIGAYDGINAIADICGRESIWLHVDAAWGGGALISNKYKYKLNGIHRADSITWNPHKLLASPQQCSVFLTKHTDILKKCNSASATYLFQKDKFYDTSYDTGDKHLQCGRRADVMKFWTMWKAKGTKGLETHINHLFTMAQLFADKIRNREGFKLLLEPECTNGTKGLETHINHLFTMAQLFADKIRNREGFKLLLEPECTNVCFYYVPPSLRNCGTLDMDRLHKIAPKVKEMMVKSGLMMITYQPLRQHTNFFRLVLQNSQVVEQDLDYFITTIEQLAADL